MDFLYRMHLIDFDPRDKEQIQKNWIRIKEAIQLSSDSLFREIENKTFDSLSPNIKAKLYKYLLRGRYRATPFGLWAGVGLGNWGKDNQIDLPVAYREIMEAGSADAGSQNQHTCKYQPAPGLKAYANQVQYWSYCWQAEGWRISYLDKNQLICILLTYFEHSPSLDFGIFQTFFKTKTLKAIGEIWDMLIVSGLLIREDFPAYAPAPPGSGVDIRLCSKITLNAVIREKLENLIIEIGNLFVPIESDYLQHFKSWFRYTYDDRFVPLSHLAHHKDFSLQSDPGIAFEQDAPFHTADILTALWKNTEEFDLSKYIEKKKPDLNHVQIAFRVFGESQLFIENIVCNRPFAYSGRFSLDPEINEYIVSKMESFPQEAVFADIVLFESLKSNHITRHQNVFEYSIFPFGSGNENNSLGIDELHLGFRGDRLVLYSQKLNKQIIPVAQHPLNPDQISHSLSRLIWEIGNQDQHRFLPYHDPSFQHSNYVPRLTWKGLILQGRKWILFLKDYLSKKELSHFLEDSILPSPIMAGHLDRELLLDWKDPLELDFLWEELQGLGEVTVYECPWKDRSPFQNKDGQHLYPQAVYSWKGKERQISPITNLNRIGSSDSSWVYVRIMMKEDGIMPFLYKPFPKIILNLKEKFTVQKWYFLFYNTPKSEIRLRVLPKDQKLIREAASELKKDLLQSGWLESVHIAPYYPETEKYGLSNADISTSESIFHRESELFLLGNDPGNLPPILSWDENERRSWVILTYCRLIELTGRQNLFFQYFKDLLKQIPGRERKELNNAEILQSKFGNTLHRADIFSTEFSKIASASEEELLRIIPNHVHMCCNRAFPLHTGDQERRVIYGLYKMLGKCVYGRFTSL